MTFQKATRQQKKLRLAIDGPSGSGKTYTALELATGLGERIALIDTERGSASLYADRFAFDVVQLETFAVTDYIAAINEAVAGKYDVLVIDSLSHAWAGTGGVLDAVNNAKGNSFTDGWGKVGTPQQNKLMDAILSAPLHIIATLRTKTAYEVEKDERGKAVPKKIGTAPVQRDGVEYEFDIVCSMSPENVLTVTKTRMVDLTGVILPRPDRKLAAKIKAWLTSGAPQKPPEPKIKPEDAPTYLRILAEERTKLEAWNKTEDADLVKVRADIINAYKAVKGVAGDVDLKEVITNNPALPSMSARQIYTAACAIHSACETALKPFAQPAQ